MPVVPGFLKIGSGFFFFFWHAATGLECVFLRQHIKKYLCNSLKGAVSHQKWWSHSEEAGRLFPMQQRANIKPVGQYEVVIGGRDAEQQELSACTEGQLCLKTWGELASHVTWGSLQSALVSLCAEETGIVMTKLRCSSKPKECLGKPSKYHQSSTPEGSGTSGSTFGSTDMIGSQVCALLREKCGMDSPVFP